MTEQNDELRDWLVARQDIDRQAMLRYSGDQARYYAGRVDAIRDVLQFIATWAYAD